MTEETEILDTPDMGVVPAQEILEDTEVNLSFSEYTQEISEDLIVITFGDGKVVDKSGPFDSRENAEAFGSSYLSALSDGSIKPNPVSVEL